MPRDTFSTPSYYVTVELRVWARSEDEAKARATKSLQFLVGTDLGVKGFVVGDTEKRVAE